MKIYLCLNGNKKIQIEMSLLICTTKTLIMDNIMLLSLTVNELKQMIEEIVEEKMKEIILDNDQLKPESDEYTTRKQVCDPLKICSTTLYNRTKF